MSKGLGIFNIFAGGICTLASILNFTNYATKESGPEVDLLRGTSAYVQQYDGESPKDVLEYVQRTLAIAGKNESFREGVGKLETQIVEISSQIGDSKTPSVYRPVLKNVGEEMKKVVDEKAQKSGALPWGIGLAGLALLNFGMGAYNFGKRDD